MFAGADASARLSPEASHPNCRIILVTGRRLDSLAPTQPPRPAELKHVPDIHHHRLHHLLPSRKPNAFPPNVMSYGTLQDEPETGYASRSCGVSQPAGGLGERATHEDLN